MERGAFGGLDGHHVAGIRAGAVFRRSIQHLYHPPTRPCWGRVVCRVALVSVRRFASLARTVARFLAACSSARSTRAYRVWVGNDFSRILRGSEVATIRSTWAEKITTHRGGACGDTARSASQAYS